MMRLRITGMPFPKKILEEKGFVVDLMHYRPPNQPRSSNPPRKNSTRSNLWSIYGIGETQGTRDSAGIRTPRAGPRKETPRKGGIAQGGPAARGRGRPGNLLCGRGLPDLFFPPVWSPIP